LHPPPKFYILCLVPLRSIEKEKTDKIAITENENQLDKKDATEFMEY